MKIIISYLNICNFNLLFIVQQESTVKKTWIHVLQALAKMVALLRTCLGIILAIAHLIIGLEHSMEEGTVLRFSWVSPITSVEIMDYAFLTSKMANMDSVASVHLATLGHCGKLLPHCLLKAVASCGDQWLSNSRGLSL